MECSDFAMRLDDLLDGGLDALQRKSVQEHLERCPDCRHRHEQALAVLESVRKLSPPAMHPGFVDQALSRATEDDRAMAAQMLKYWLQGRRE